jgi:2-polyprenyl-6-methoxyphenol hydroxylase-like FAD-dependent oxidoreductase
MALEPSGNGVPARLETKSRVAKVDVENATITLENGKTFQGDVVIGADGVHVSFKIRSRRGTFTDDDQSKTRLNVPGGDIKPFGSGKSAFRFLIPRKTLLEDPETKSFVENKGILIMFIGEDRRFVMYPCSNNELLNFVVIHPSSESEASDGK